MEAMVALSDVPINSLTWLMGSLASLTLSYRSLTSYRIFKNELSKYIGWFGLLVGTGLVLLAVPAFFTLDTSTLRITYLAGEFFVYSAAVAQAAALWCLMLRSRVPIHFITIFVAISGLVSWLYALPRSTLHISDDFITYRDPAFSTIVIGTVLLSLFVPVGIYFLRSATKQSKLKAKLTSLVLGLVYVGIGFFTGGVELLAGQVITPQSAIVDLAFFSIMLAVMVWPRHAAVNTS